VQRGRHCIISICPSQWGTLVVRHHSTGVCRLCDLILELNTTWRTSKELEISVIEWRKSVVPQCHTHYLSEFAISVQYATRHIMTHESWQRLWVCTPHPGAPGMPLGNIGRNGNRKHWRREAWVQFNFASAIEMLQVTKNLLSLPITTTLQFFATACPNYQSNPTWEKKLEIVMLIVILVRVSSQYWVYCATRRVFFIFLDTPEGPPPQTPPSSAPTQT